MKSNAKFNSDDFIKELGAQLGKVDRTIIAALSKRMDLARLVEQWKHAHGNKPILRQEIETGRLNAFSKEAQQQGISPEFARSLLYLIISESCRVQIDQLQTRTEIKELTTEERRTLLRKNLLKLTDTIARTYNERYRETAPFATRICTDFEDTIIIRESTNLRNTGNNKLAIDLGCATGRTTLKLSSYFKKVIGLDISPAMIEVAKINQTRNVNFLEKKNVSFQIADIETGIPVENNSASLIIMNLGTASDIIDITLLLARIENALMKNGKFVLSFYNSGALFYQWFIPWAISLTASIDTIQHCLNVHVDDQVFSIHARPYTVREIKKIMNRRKGLQVTQIATFPTISAILPDGFFMEKNSRKAMISIDKKLSVDDHGAYIIVSGRKS